MSASPISLDTETALIRPALLAPPLVCVTSQRPNLAPKIVHQSDAKPYLRSVLDGNNLIIGANIAYDMGVIGERFSDLLPLIFKAYREDRVVDVQIRQKLLDIAGGVYRGRVGDKGKWIKHEYSLEALAKRCSGIQLLKDGWRLSYAAFIDTPLSLWPEKAREVQASAAAELLKLPSLDGLNKKELDAIPSETRDAIRNLRALVDSDPSQCVQYPLDDAKATLAVYQAQEAHASYLADQFRQTRHAWWRHLSSAWGLKTDKQGVEVLRRETQARLEEVEDELKQLGLVRDDGSRDTKAAAVRMLEVCKREGLEIRRTAAHNDECGSDPACHVCLDSDACEATDDEVLAMYAELSTLKKVLSNDIEALEKGTYWPVHTRYDIAATGRTTSSKPNIQNVRRLAGIREAFVPRTGRLFAEADYPQLELYTLAQCCMSWLGRSKLAEALNAGLDPHMAVAAQILGTTYEDASKNKKTEEVKKARGGGKVANFGIPGGLGVDSLVDYAKKAYGVDLTREQAKFIRDKYFETWTEMPAYFARVNALINPDTNRATVETLFTKRFRGSATYCAACNNGFQALGADCAQNAGFLIAQAQYVDSTSPLFNTRTVAFIHDEFILEVDDAPSAHDAAYELARLMVEGANIYLPDVPIPLSKMEPLLMRRWSKDAVSTFDAEGRLIPWQPM